MKKIKKHFSLSAFNWSGIEDSVTFGDPAATSLKTSFQELAALRTAAGSSHHRPLLGQWYEIHLSITNEKLGHKDRAFRWSP